MTWVIATTQTHALNNLGTALWASGELIEGRIRLTQSLDLALADDAHEHAARAYTNIGASSVKHRSYAEAAGSWRPASPTPQTGTWIPGGCT